MRRGVIDSGGGPAYPAAMTLPRRAFLCLLLIALLPWGAWLSAGPAQAVAPPFAIASPRAGADVAQAAPVAHQCRTGLAPGQGCGPDSVLLPAAMRLDRQGDARLWPAPAAATGRGIVPDIGTPPPRQG